MTMRETYDPEVSTNFFDELETAVGYRPHYRRVYQAMNHTFQKFISLKTSLTRLNLGGPFAKTDYLLKEYKAPRRLFKTTNDTRTRLRRQAELSEVELERYCMTDLRNLCQFFALVCDCPVPSSLVRLFPTEKVPAFAPRLVGKCMRVIVERWDDTFVYVQAEAAASEEPLKVCYARGNAAYDYDWTYLRDMFHEGTQLNLVRPRLDDGIIYPELIIFEPDYLVNISTVAHCFTNYADSPLVDLIKKLEPPRVSEAIVLGNLASQLLDESIHQLPNTHSYAESAREFFHNHALSLLTAGISPQFHGEAQRQKQNIFQAVNVALPAALQRFNPSDGLVEPSFFSEMLGLQGRMDYLQMDFKVLMEQKSGKGSFPYDHFVIPRQTDEHYVQLLLYMALIRYNFWEEYERNGRELHAFLLYSRYSQSLLGLGFSPELIFKAIKVRNGIAWTELQCAKPDGFKILDTLTPERLNLKNASNTLWTQYQARQISDILTPIQQASELERAYYFRFLSFIACEHVLSKLGNKTKESSGFAATWHDSLADKLAAGNIYDNLTLVRPDGGTKGPVAEVVLRFSENDDNDMSNFRTGDIVILYPYEKGREPDARKTMVFRCTIEDIQTDSISLALRAAQTDNRVFLRQQDKLWAIEHDFMEATYSALYKGMQAFLTAPKQRRDLLLLQREPDVDTNVALNGDYGDFSELALRVKQARDLFLIIGPPGTGKTSYGLLYTVREELTEPGTSVLLLSFTNRAVDEICSKLSADGIDFIRIGSPLSCATAYRDRLLSAIAQQTPRADLLKERISSTRVFVGTTTSLNANLSLFRLKQFSLAVIDEASQILEPHLMGLLSASVGDRPAIRKFVLIGDHKQLPAVVQQTPDVSEVRDSRLRAIHLSDCSLSLFERLLKRYAQREDVAYMLRKQGRMHHDIAAFPNDAFYNNRLTEVPLAHQTACLPLQGRGTNGIDDLLATRRIVFLASEAPPKDSPDKVNQVEADMIAAIVVRIYEREKASFDASETVGVIVPYRNQIATVRKTIDHYGIPLLHDITIDTVERYQGSQRRYIVYGFTIHKYYQLSFLTSHVFEDFDGSIVDRKLNVAMTRAEEHLIMIGRPELLANNYTFFKLMAYVGSRHGFFRVGKDDFVAGRFAVPQYAPQPADPSQAAFTVSEPFREAFQRRIRQPLQERSGHEWPARVLGRDMAGCLDAIAYGRSPERQPLLYGHYFLTQHYGSSASLLSACHEWMGAQIAAVSGRVQVIDIGCALAAWGIAFAERFINDAPSMVYTGIDVSEGMRSLAGQLLGDMFKGQLHTRMLHSLTALGDNFWDGCSELPSLVVFSLPYFFQRVTAQTAEQLATQISSIMDRHPLNRYLFIIQHAEHDQCLNAWQVFRHVLAPHTVVVRSGRAALPCLSGQPLSVTFCYDILAQGYAE